MNPFFSQDVALIHRLNAALDWDFLALHGVTGERDVNATFIEDHPVSWIGVYRPFMVTAMGIAENARIPFLFKVIQAGPSALAHVIRKSRETGCLIDWEATFEFGETRPGCHSMALRRPEIAPMTPMYWALALMPDREFLTPEGHRPKPRTDGEEKDPESVAVAADQARQGLVAFETLRCLLDAGVEMTNRDFGQVGEKSLMFWRFLESRGLKWTLGNPMNQALQHVRQPGLEIRARHLLNLGCSIEGGFLEYGTPLTSQLASTAACHVPEARVLVRLGASPHVVVTKAHQDRPANQNLWHLVFAPFRWNTFNGRMDKGLMNSLGLKLLWLTLHKVDPNLVDSEGQTPWHVAAQSNLPEVFGRILLHAGARWDGLDKNGKTPLDIARENGCRELVHFLVTQKALQDRTSLGGLLPEARTVTRVVPDRL